MEVGAVKQAFNNEVILLKKNLSQAKIQIIHKLTRKAKQLTEKKAPEKLQEKLKRKAESAVKEVLIIKKIKPKDIAKFIVTHKGELNSFLNKPQVDEDKACARLLLHKALQEKYKFIRGRFSNVPIKDLFMSRLERRKMKKEAKEKQKNKKKDKNSQVVNSEGDWDVEDVGDKSKLDDDDVNGMSGDDEGNEMSGDDEGNEMSGDDDGNDMSGDDDMSSDDNGGNEESGDESDRSEDGGVEDDDGTKDLEEDNDSVEEPSDSELKEDSSKILKQTPKAKPAVVDNKTKGKKTEVSPKTFELKEIKNPKPQKEIIKKNAIKKQKELNKAKNFNEKILQKKLKKDSDAPAVEKIVDPFFITSTGENYMSVVEPRAPDEIKDEHMQGNRKLRRAVMFGHVPKSRLRQNNNYHNEDNRFNKQNGYDRGNNYKSKFNDRPQFNDRRNFNDKKSFNNDFNDRRNFNDKRTFNNDFNDKRGFNRNDRVNEEPEKLHPSWEAKRKKSGILPFEGKKIVFDES